MKKFIAAIIIAALFLSGSAYAEGGETLSSLGLASASMFENDFMTKAEFISVVAKILNLSDSSSSKVFADLRPNHEYYGAVSALAEFGLINGDENGYVNPDDPITYNQAAKILIGALGYTEYAELKGGYPYGYSIIANDIRLNAGISYAGDSWMSISDAETMLYNSLNIGIMAPSSYGNEITYKVTNETLLSKYHDIYKTEGIVMGTHDIKLITSLKIGKTQVQVDDFVYNCGTVDFDSIVGYNIDLYYKEAEGEYTAVAAVPQKGKNNVVTISNEDVIRVSGRSIYYTDENDKTCHVTLSPDAYLMYNNVPAERFSAEDFKGIDGKIRLIDINGDETYGTVFIEAWRNIAVAAVDSENSIIYDKYSDYILNIDDETLDKTVIFLDEYGRRMEIEELKEYDVLSVMESKDKSLVTVYYSNTEVEGSVTSIEEHSDVSYITINAKQYPVTTEFLKRSGISIGDCGLFVMNINKKIGAFKKFTGDTIRYGYLMEAASSSGVGSDYEYKILTSADTIEIYPCAKTVLLDSSSGKGVTPSAAYNTLAQGNTSIAPQIIRYKLNSAGEITFIDTGNTTANEYDEYLDKFYSARDVLFVKRINMFASKAPINSSTVAFCVPEPGTESNEEYFRSYRASDYFANNNRYNITAYKAQPNRHFAEAILSTTNYNNPAIHASSPVFVVDKISYTVNENGDTRYKITGYENGSRKELITKSVDTVDSMKNGHKLKTGDVIRYATYENSEVISLNLVYDIENTKLMTSNPSNSDSNAQYRFIAGNVYSVDEGNILVSTNEITGNMTMSQLESYNASIYPVCIYNPDKENKVYLGSTADIQSYKITGEGSKIFIASYYSSPGMIYVIK